MNLVSGARERGIDLGRALRNYRITARINQAVMARTLGVSQSQISRWESGRDRPRAHNEAAIRAMIWGREDPVLAGLIRYGRGAAGPLVLFDPALTIIAASPFLRGTGGPLALFGWLFDPQTNPEYPRLAARCAQLAARPQPTLGIRMEMPFSHEARPWACIGRLSFYPIGPDAYAIGELSFMRDDGLRVERMALHPITAGPGVAGSGDQTGAQNTLTARPEGSRAAIGPPRLSVGKRGLPGAYRRGLTSGGCSWSGCRNCSPTGCPPYCPGP